MIPRFHHAVSDYFTLRAPCGGADCLVPVTVGPFASCDLR